MTSRRTAMPKRKTGRHRAFRDCSNLDPPLGETDATYDETITCGSRFWVSEAIWKAPEIRTYVVPLDNIWSGSAFRNICPTGLFGVRWSGRTYVWKVGAAGYSLGREPQDGPTSRSLPSA